MVVEVTLILNYVCVLLIKTCDPSLVRSSTADDELVAKAMGWATLPAVSVPHMANGDAHAAL